MKKMGSNQIVLIACWLLVAGTGTYLTFFQQQSELEHLQREVKLEKQMQADLSALLAEMAASEKEATDVVAKWRARYKVIPKTISSPEIVGYLNELTQQGFKSFDITSAGVQNQENYGYHTFQATGRGYYSSLYHFIWELENSRKFYRVRDLQLSHLDLRTTNDATGREGMEILVSFDMSIDALFGGPEGISADDTVPVVAEEERLPVGRSNEQPSVPAEVLPDRQPATDPFYPLVMQQLPPNERGLVDVEKDELVSIVENKAVFKTGEGYVMRSKGADVYLGRIIEVEPRAGRVVARLNKGGIIDEVELTLDNPDPLNQARGPQQLAPLDNQDSSSNQ